MADHVIRIWHDPGHLSTSSNRGLEHAGFIERDWVYKFAQGYALRNLSYMYPSEGVAYHALARRRVDSVRYHRRAIDAERWSADLAVLHHVNGIFFPDEHPRAGQANSSESGLSVFVVEGTDPVHEQSYRVARDLLLAVRHPLRLWKNRITPHRSKRFGKDGKRHWTSRARSHLHHYVDRGIPAVLIEWGFATNDSDRWLLLDEARHDLFYRPLDAAIRGFAERRKR